MNINVLKELILKENDFLDVLPYHIGLEIECDTEIKYIRDYLDKIPCVETDNSTGELRIKFDTGLNGLCQLYCLTLFLHKYSSFNEGSGIHYNIDMLVNNLKVSTADVNQRNIVLNELTKWEYKGTYNKYDFSDFKGYWCTNRKNRLEIRIGEMSFDFDFILNRIQSCNFIIDSLLAYKKQERIVVEEYKFDDIEEYLNFIDLLEEIEVHDVVKTYKNKTIKCY